MQLYELKYELQDECNVQTGLTFEEADRAAQKWAKRGYKTFIAKQVTNTGKLQKDK